MIRKMMVVPATCVLMTVLSVIWIFWCIVPLEEKSWAGSSTAPTSSSVLFLRPEHLRVSASRTSASSSSDGQEPSELELAWKKQELIDSMRIFVAAPSPSPASTESHQSVKDSCSGKRIYIHQLPPKFNQEILQQCETFLPWFSMCDYFTNSGMGVPIVSNNTQLLLSPQGKWFQTNQYALDVLFHQKLLHYQCLTDSPDQASLFYVPYYAGLDVLRYHYTNESLEKKNELGVELIGWLKQQRWWWKKNGQDHVLVMGKITWDFRRNDETMWGNTLLKMPDFSNMMKLLLERDPWEVNEISVPHPTYFHPSSDLDFSTWISRIAASDRKHLISFAGMPRDPENVRTHIIRQCQSSPLCELLSCAGKLCDSPEPTMELFLSSQFCMQPPGDSATRRSVFDSLIAGCIPVLFHSDTAYFQYPWHLPADSASYSVYVSSDDVKSNRVDVIKLVASISEEQKQRMRTKIINEIVPGLLYSQPGTKLAEYEDAFDISIKGLLNKAKATSLY